MELKEITLENNQVGSRPICQNRCPAVSFVQYSIPWNMTISGEHDTSQSVVFSSRDDVLMLRGRVLFPIQIK